MNRTNSYIFIFLAMIFSYHYFIQNTIEKQFSLTLFGYDNAKRPMSDSHMFTIRDIGMPSGVAEISTIIACILYFYKYISSWICIVLIFIFSAQRVFTNRHTIAQVIAGIICGIIYSYIYTSNNLSLLSFGIVIFIGLLLFLSILYKNNQEKDKSVNNVDNKTIISYLYEIIH